MKNKNNRPSLLMHINFAEQGSSLEEGLRWARKCGYDGVEVRRRDLFGGLADSDYLDRLCLAFEASGLEKVIIGAPGVDLVQKDESASLRAAESAMEFYRQASGRLPVVAVNFLTGEMRHSDSSVHFHDWHLHGSALAGEEDWARIARRTKAFAEIFGELKLPAGVESHMRYLHDTLAATVRFLDAVDSPHVGATLDAGNILAMENPPTMDEMLAALASRTSIAHLKNFYRTFHGQVVMSRLKDGDVNNRQLVSGLLRAGFRGPIVIEAPGSGDRLSWAAEDLRYILELLEEVPSAPSPVRS
jgi:sugar phosphate isomerase/epimerase